MWGFVVSLENLKKVEELGLEMVLKYWLTSAPEAQAMLETPPGVS